MQSRHAVLQYTDHGIVCVRVITPEALTVDDDDDDDELMLNVLRCHLTY